MVVQVARQGTGQDRQQDVVDGRADGMAGALDLVEWQAVGVPGHLLVAVGPSEEDRGFGHRRQEQLDAPPGEVEGLLGPAHRPGRVQRHRRGLRDPLAGEVPQLGPEVHRRWVDHRHGALVGLVGQAEQQPHQRQPVTDAVVDAHVHGAAGAAVALEDRHRPRWAPPVQWLAALRAAPALQHDVVARCRQVDHLDVVVEVELAVLHPPGHQQRVGRRHDALAEHRMPVQHAIDEERPQRVHVHRPVEPEDGRDHHRVAGVLAPEPDGVRRGEPGGHEIHSRRGRRVGRPVLRRCPRPGRDGRAGWARPDGPDGPHRVTRATAGDRGGSSRGRGGEARRVAPARPAVPA